MFYLDCESAWDLSTGLLLFGLSADQTDCGFFIPLNVSESNPRCSGMAAGKVILESAILTSVVVVSLTLYTFWAAKRGHDFQFLGPFLFGALLVLIVFAFIQVPPPPPVSSWFFLLPLMGEAFRPLVQSGVSSSLFFFLLVLSSSPHG